MFFMPIVLLFFLFLASVNSGRDYVHPSHPHPSKVLFYPKNSLFRKAALIDMGCAIFLTHCPSAYKKASACARHYNGHFKSFQDYCSLEYENCNTWRQWSLFKYGSC